MKKLIIFIAIILMAVSLNAQHIIIATVIVEGHYNASTNQMVRSDTVLIEVHNQSSPYGLIVSSRAFIDSVTFDGFTGQMVGLSNGDYICVVKHRNSIETWREPTTIGGSHTPINFTAPGAIYGNNLAQVDASPVTYAIYSGDVNQDGAVDGTDASLVDTDATNFVSGDYVITDLNYDGTVDGTDVAIADNNASNFVITITP